MEKRLKIFWDYEVDESRVNEWLKKSKGKLHEMHFAGWKTETGSSYALVFLYTPEALNEKKEQNSKENEESDGRIQARVASFWKQGGPQSRIKIPSCCDWYVGGEESSKIEKKEVTC